MQHQSWVALTDEEQKELSNRIKAGEVEPDEEREEDHFWLQLKTGRTVRGYYHWGSELGEFMQLTIVDWDDE